MAGRGQTRVAIAWALVATLAPLVAQAQGGNDGSVIGYVLDQTGNPIRGVKIVASSPTQIGGSKTTYTNDEGMFRLGNLFPGTFQVSASAPKLKTVIQKDIHVGITAAAEVNLVMEVQTERVEEVKVLETAPTVSTTSTNVKEVYDLDYVESLPLNSRDQVFNQMVNQIGGAVNGRIRGGATNQTLFTQDGFDMRDQWPVTKSSAAYEIQSAGYGADNAAASGGIVNLVTKTGSNKWEFELNATAENEALRFGTDSRDRPGNFYYLVNPAVAGPIIRDRLWFAFAYETHFLGRGREPDPEGLLPAPKPHLKGLNKGTLKLTWQVSPRNKLSFLSNFDSAWNTNQKNELGVEADAQQNRRAGLSGLWGVIWETLLTDNLFLRTQAAYSRRPQYWYPAACESGNPFLWPWFGAGDSKLGDCDMSPGRINRYPRRLESLGTAMGCTGTGECDTANVQPHQRWDLDIYQASSRLQWFVNHKVLGEHSIVLKDQLYNEVETRRMAQPGDYFDEYNGAIPEARSTFFANDPRLESGRYGWWIAVDTLYRNNASLSDSWRPTRHLTVTPAISYLWAKGENSAGDTVISNSAWAPSVAAAWDATHDGRSVIRGSYSQYVDVAIRTPTVHTLGAQVKRRCLWNATGGPRGDGFEADGATPVFDRDCVYSGGASKNTFGLPCGPTGFDATGTSCRENLQIPRTHEYALGAEREIVQGIALALDFIYRDYANQYEERETNRIWNVSGNELLGYRNGRNETIVDMGTPDGARRAYRGATLALNKRQGRFKSYASYTLSELTGTVFNGSNNRWGDIPGRDVYLDGALPDDRRHDLKLSATVAATRWLSFGGRYQYSSGFPYSRLFRNEVTNAYESYRARVGINPGTDINDPGDDRPLRLPDLHEVSVQGRVNLAPLIHHNLDLYIDALNILNLRTATQYGQNDGANFGVEQQWMPPFRIRLGLNYRY